MIFDAFVQSSFLKTVATFSSFMFLSVFLLNPDMYSNQDQYRASAQFLTNDYSVEQYIVDPSLSDLEATPSKEKTQAIISYTVKSSDTLSAIANKYGVSVEKLKTLNNIKDERRLRPNTILYISSQEGFVYVTKEITSAFVFSNLYDLDLDELMKANGQEDSMTPFSPGQPILVPKKALTWAYDVGLLSKPEEPKRIILTKKSNKETNTKIATTSNPRQVASAKPLISDVSNGKGSIVSSWRETITENYGFAKNYCTSYAAARADFAFGKDAEGNTYIGRRGDAKNRSANAKKKGFKVSSTPSVGSIGVMSNGGNGNPAGHVVIVESVDRKTKMIKVSDMNYSGKGIVTVRFISMNDDMTQAESGRQRFIGFIPVQDRP